MPGSVAQGAPAAQTAAHRVPAGAGPCADPPGRKILAAPQRWLPMEMPDVPHRPPVVLAAAGLLLGSALVLLAGWASGIDAVESNGARVFFAVLWSYLAWSVYSGGGWVRTAILAIFAIAAWGAFNAASPAQYLAAIPAGDAVAKALAALALLAMWAPPAHRYFAATRTLRNQQE